MGEEIRERIRRLRERYGIPTAEKRVPLFRPGVDETCMATVYHCDDIRAVGFRIAADKLIDVAVKEPGYADYLVYAVGYLYRMYLESRLKTIIESVKPYPTVHDLEDLWEEAKPAIKSSSQWIDNHEFYAVEEKIQEFSKIDPFSDAFRYSKNKKGKPTLEAIQTVDLKHLKEVIDSMSTLLEGSYTAIFEDRQRDSTT